MLSSSRRRGSLALGALVGALALAVGLLVPGAAAAQEATPTDPPSSASSGASSDGSGAPVASGAAAVPTPAPPVPGAFVPLQAARLFDSRDGSHVVDQGFARAPGPIGPGQVVGVPVAGRGGVPDVGAGTVVLNVTGTTLFGSSFLTVWPQGAPRPPASSLSFTPSDPVSTTIVTKLGDGGAVSLFNVSGLSDATVDVVGWFPEDSPMVSGVPQRLLDTRSGTVGGPLGPGESRTVRVDGGFAPTPAGSSVLVNLVGTGATEPTSVSTSPAGGPSPAAPTLSLAPGDSLPTTTVVGVGEGGAITLTNRAGSVDLLVDLIAVLPSSVGRSLAPARLVDTRIGTPAAPGSTTPPAPAGALNPGSIRTVPVLGRGGIPAEGVSSVMLTVTGIEPTSTGAVGVWGAGPPPTTSAVVVPAGAVRPGFAVVPVSPEGTVQLAVAGSAMNVVVDVVGYLSGTPAAAPTTAAPTTSPDGTSPDTTSPTTPGATTPGATTDPTAPAPDGGDLLWQADYAKGLGQYRSTPWNIVGAPTPRVGTLPGGTKPAVAFTMPGGGQRSEIEPNFRSLRSGDDLYFGFSVTLAPGFPAATDDWQVITQWKNAGTGSPPLSVKVGKGQFLLDGGFDRGSPFQVPMGTAVPGRTQKVVVHVVFADGGGSVDTWVDGKQTLTGFRPPAGTLYSGLTSYLKTGIYRNTAIGQPGTLYFDDWRIATSYAAAYPR